MTRSLRRVPVTLAALAALPLLPAAAGAQLASASASVLGTGQNATATVRGFASIALNPAGLGMPGTPGFSLALVPLRVRSGLGPVTLGDLADHQGVVVPDEVKEAWLADIRSAGAQRGTLGLRASGLSLNAGPFGLQVSSVASGTMDLSPGVAELVLFGNAGRTGEPVDVDVAGSAFTAFAVSTVGVSYGLDLPAADGSMAVGATVKYHVGHALALARRTTGSLESDPVRGEFAFPSVVVDDEDFRFDNGNGLGLDVGFQWERDAFAFGASVLDVVSSFAWDRERFVYREGTAVLSQEANASDFDRRPLGEAGAELIEAIDDATYRPVVSLGGAWSGSPGLVLSADVRRRIGEGLDVGPETHVGVGARYRALPVLELRAGGALVTGGGQIGGGASLVLGPVHLSGALLSRMLDASDQVIGQLTLSFGGH